MVTREFHLIAAKKRIFDNCNNGYIDRAWRLGVFPKIDKHIVRKLPSIDVGSRRIKYLPTIRKIPEELWNEIKLLLPP
jgi:hypothetical protein